MRNRFTAFNLTEPRLEPRYHAQPLHRVEPARVAAEATEPPSKRIVASGLTGVVTINQPEHLKLRPQK